MKKQKNNKLPYCGELVRNADPDRFLLSMFVPAQYRADVWAVLAFNYEIAKTREVVSESTLGLIRLQWWRDMIGGIYEGQAVPEHEVLKPLETAIKSRDLSREMFEKLIYAREFDLENVQPGNIEGLMNYADFTTTPLLELIVKIMGDDPAQEFIQPMAINSALIGVLRATPFHARQGRLLLPEDLTMKHDITIDNIFEEDCRKRVCDLVQEIMDAMPERASADNLFLKSMIALSDLYARQIRVQGYDVISPLLQREPFFKVLRVFWKTKIL